jgi:hypothetical protein
MICNRNSWILRKGFRNLGGSLIRIAAAAVALLAGSRGYADILSTTATVKPNNSLLVDAQVTTSASVEHVSIAYQTPGRRPAGHPSHPGFLHRLDHDHYRKAEGKSGIHLHC